MLESIAEGSQVMAHANNATFRNKSENANIYIRNHLSSADRAALAEFKFNQTHLPKALFKQNDPIRKHFLRPKVPTNDNHAVLRHKPLHEGQRIQEGING